MSFTGSLVTPPHTTIPNTVTPGPIQGDPENALQFAGTSKIVSSNFATGEAGDFDGLSAFTVELWARIDTAGLVSFGLLVGPETHLTTPTFQWHLDVDISGAFSFTVTATGPVEHTVVGNVRPVTGTWYHIAGVWNSPNAYLYVNGTQDATSNFGAITIDGMATNGTEGLSMGATFGGNWSAAEVAIWRRALSSTRVAAHYTAGALRGWNAQKSGARIGAVLDTVDSQAPRSLQAGVRSVAPRFMTGQSAKTASLDALNADYVDSALFIARMGTVTYLAADNRSKFPYNISQGTYGDAGGTELQYLDRGTDYSDSYLANDWLVTAEGSRAAPGITQESSDATSIATYGIHTAEAQLPVVSDSDASTVAAAMLAKYKDPLERITSIKPNMADPATAVNVYRRDLMDLITVKWSPPGGGSRPSQNVYIQSITHNGSPGVPPSCEFGVSPL